MTFNDLSKMTDEQLQTKLYDTKGDTDAAFSVALLNEYNTRKGVGYKRDLHSSGAKDDSKKPDLDLVLGDFATALQLVGCVGTYGAKKYSKHGWLVVDNGVRRYSSAMLRHYFLESEGEYLDSETDLPHAAAVAWNALARLQLILNERKDKMENK